MASAARKHPITGREELVLRPSRRKTLLLVVSCSALFAAGVWRWEQVDTLEALILLLFGLGSIVFGILLLPGASYLKLTEKGFIVCSLFRETKLVPWRVVSNFRAEPIPPALTDFVVFDSTGHEKRGLRRFKRTLAGAKDALPDSYGRTPQDLAELLNARRGAAVGDTHPRSD